MLSNIETLLIAFVLAAIVLAVPTLICLCAYNSVSQAIGLKRRLSLRCIVKSYVLLCVASAAYSSILPQDTLPANPLLHPNICSEARSGFEPTLPARALSHATAPLVISAPDFLTKLGQPVFQVLSASYGLPSDPTLKRPASLQLNSVMWGTSALWSNNDAFTATVLFVDDSCSAVAVYQAKTGSPPEDGKTPQLPAVASFGAFDEGMRRMRLQVPLGASTALVVHAHFGYTFWSMPAANLSTSAHETAVAVAVPVVTTTSVNFEIALADHEKTMTVYAMPAPLAHLHPEAFPTASTLTSLASSSPLPPPSLPHTPTSPLSTLLPPVSPPPSPIAPFAPLSPPPSSLVALSPLSTLSPRSTLPTTSLTPTFVMFPKAPPPSLPMSPVPSPILVPTPTAVQRVSVASPPQPWSSNTSVTGASPVAANGVLPAGNTSLCLLSEFQAAHDVASVSSLSDGDALWLASGASAYIGLVVLSGLLGGMLSHVLRPVLGRWNEDSPAASAGVVASEQKLDGFEHSCLVERGSVGDALEADLQATVRRVGGRARGARDRRSRRRARQQPKL